MIQNFFPVLFAMVLFCPIGRAQVDCQVAYDSILGKQDQAVRDTRTRKDDLLFAAKLLAIGKRMKLWPDFQILVLEKAYTFSLKGDRSIALAAMRCLKDVPGANVTQATQRFVDLLRKEFRSGKGDDQDRIRAELHAHYMKSAEACFNRKGYDAAANYYRKALSLGGSEFTETVKDQLARAIFLKNTMARCSNLTARYQREPGNRDVAFQLYLLHFIELNDHAKAYPYLLAAKRNSSWLTMTRFAGSKTLPLDQHLPLARWYSQQVLPHASRNGKIILLDRASHLVGQFISNTRSETDKLEACVLQGEIGTLRRGL